MRNARRLTPTRPTAALYQVTRINAESRTPDPNDSRHHEFIPHSPADIAEMLAEVGGSVDGCSATSPPPCARARSIWSRLPEQAVRARLEVLARQNRGAQYLNFLGAGAYPTSVRRWWTTSCSAPSSTPPHTVPARGQQGTLQAIFEFRR
jgi:glycine cleavage system pyridoxal-binding protein P